MAIISVVGVDQSEVMQETWGHLAPESGKIYRGKIMFSFNQYKEAELWGWEMEGLNASPWQFAHFTHLTDVVWDLEIVEAGSLWVFNGSYMVRDDGEWAVSGLLIEWTTPFSGANAPKETRFNYDSRNC